MISNCEIVFVYVAVMISIPSMARSKFIRQESEVIKNNLLGFSVYKSHHQTNWWGLKSFDCQI